MLLAEKQGYSENIYNINLQTRVDRRMNLKPFYAVIGLFLCLMVANLWIQVLVVKRDREISDYQSLIRKLERQNIQIQLEIAKLDSFERIQTEAQKMGMRVAGPNDYYCIGGAPKPKGNENRIRNYAENSGFQDNQLWAKVASWIKGIKSVMAHPLDN